MVDFDANLINEVRLHPILYDVSLNDYGNVVKEDLVWKDISTNLQMDETICRRKWHTLLNYYQKRYNLQSKDNYSKEKQQKYWRYIKMLSFLDDFESKCVSHNKCSTDLNNTSSTYFTELKSSKTKPEIDWNELLIIEIKKYPLLYRKDLDIVDLIRKREEKWKEISSRIKLSTEMCKKRWKAIRDTYIRLKRKLKRRPAAMNKEQFIKWRYFELLSFLNNNEHNNASETELLTADDESKTDLADISETKKEINTNFSNIVEAEDNSQSSYLLNEVYIVNENEYENAYAENTDLSNTVTYDKDRYDDNTNDSCSYLDGDQCNLEFISFSNDTNNIDRKNLEQNCSNNSHSNQLNDMHNKLINSFNKATSNIINIKRKYPTEETATSSTMVVFTALAKKIKMCNFSRIELNKIEAKVSDLVFSEIDKYTNVTK